MDVRTLRRHGVFALTFILLLAAVVGALRTGSKEIPQGLIRIMIISGLMLGLLGTFYVADKWRLVCEVAGVCCALGAVVLLFVGRA